MVEHPVEGNEVISEQSVLTEQQQAALGEGAVPADLVDQELLDRFVVNLLLRVARFDLFLGPMQVLLKEGQLVLENGLMADPFPFDALQPDPLVAVN